MSHTHNHSCTHAHVAYCASCRFVYCKDCHVEWRQTSAWYGYNPYYTTVGQGILMNNGTGVLDGPKGVSTVTSGYVQTSDTTHKHEG